MMFYLEVDDDNHEVKMTPFSFIVGENGRQHGSPHFCDYVDFVAVQNLSEAKAAYVSNAKQRKRYLVATSLGGLPVIVMVIAARKNGVQQFYNQFQPFTCGCGYISLPQLQPE
ncbi:hypothetical protein ACLOJK_012718 [Asimina triloba]